MWREVMDRLFERRAEKRDSLGLAGFWEREVHSTSSIEANRAALERRIGDHLKSKQLRGPSLDPAGE